MEISIRELKKAKKGDLALVDNVEYRFTNGSWAKV
jgi:hypothetical protein